MSQQAENQKHTTTTPETEAEPKWGRGTNLMNERHARIHQRLRQERLHPPAEGRIVNAEDFAALFGVTVRTIYRDIEEMKSCYRLPIDTIHGGRGGYRYLEEVVEFPGLQLSASELSILVLGMQALPCFSGAAPKKLVKSASGKLFSALDPRVAADLQRLSSLITFLPSGYEAPIDPAVFESAVQALLDQEEITFTHTKPDPGAKPLERHVQPRHIAWIMSNWYLYCDDLGRGGKARQFALNRIRKLRSTGIRFIPTKPFKLKVRRGKSLGVHTGGGDAVQVRVRLTPAVRTFALERNWHETQRFTDLPDGGLEVTMETYENAELLRWVRQWGPEVEVIEPVSLRETIVAEARALLARHGER